MKHTNTRPEWLIYSTQTNDTMYVEYKHKPVDGVIMPGPNPIARFVTIEGGANVGKRGLVTPKGVMTGVNQSNMDFLNNNASFLNHKAKGFITVIKGSGWPDAPDDIANDMTSADESAPLTPAWFTGQGKTAPLVGNEQSETKKTTRRTRGAKPKIGAFK